MLPGINLSKLSDFEIKECRVSQYSVFADNRWKLESASIKKVLIFNKNKYRNDETIRFIKTFLYYSIPENHPTGKVKSLNTTNAYQGYLRSLTLCLFDEFAISDPSRDIQNLTLDQLNKSLDKAKTISYSMYGSIFYVYALWFTLSEYGLLPEIYRLPCERNHLLTKERRSDIFDYISSQAEGWQPFNEDELTKLVDFIIPQLEIGRDRLEKIADYAIENNITNVRRSSTIKKKTDELLGLLPLPSTNFDSEEPDTLFQLINNYKQAVYAFLALITGLRRRELNALKFDSFEKINSTSCRVTVTRWKTSDDPNNHGTTDSILVPIIVFESLETLKKIVTAYYQSEPTHLSYSKYDVALAKESGISSEFVALAKKLCINLHFHRFRKTIASLLIMQSEKNIELIRFLFGHKSYAMTMHYIMRNPFLIEDVTKLMEHHYCKEFSGLLGDIINGHYSGKAAEQIAENIKNNTSAFSGDFLHTTIKEYVSALLEAGEPIFIHRIPLGGTCVSVPVLASKPTPCTKNMKYTDRIKPDVSMCEGEYCPKAVFSKTAVPALTQNIKYYESILTHNINNMSDKLIQKYERLLYVTKEHVENIQRSRPIFIEMDQIDHV